MAKLPAKRPLATLKGHPKQSRPGRKVGHVNATGTDLSDVLFEARAAAATLND